MPRSRLLTRSEIDELTPSPFVVRERLAHASSRVSVAWSWYDEAKGVVEWSFANEGTSQHSVILLRNGYYFAGAFWPVYWANSGGRGASAANQSDNFGTEWATAIAPLVDNGVRGNSPPICLADFGGRKKTVVFLFTLAPGETWSMVEGGFSASMTPSGISLHEAALESSGDFCIGYDPRRVTDWDQQTGTSLRGYSPDPSTFNTVEIRVEGGAPFDTLPYDDPAPANGPCQGQQTGSPS